MQSMIADSLNPRRGSCFVLGWLCGKARANDQIYKRRNQAGEIVGWSAGIKIPGLSMWTNVRRDEPRDFYGSIYPTKDAAIEGAKREIIRRGGGPKREFP
jgi:hypothetical protein